MDGVAQGPQRKGAHQGRRPSAGAHRARSSRGGRRPSRTARSPRRRTSSAATRSSQAADLAAAVELTSGCPIFDVASGFVEVRPVMKMGYRGARRPSVPARSGPHGRRADARLRRPQPRAGGRRRAGRLLPRAGGVEVPRRAGQPVGVADDHGQEPRHRRAAPRAHRAHVRARARAAARERVDARPDGRRALRPGAPSRTTCCG